jgi:hypothetical protein
MANGGTLEVNVRLTGDLAVVVRAFGIMSAALAAYGHEFSEADELALSEAAECLSRALEAPADE